MGNSFIVQCFKHFWAVSRQLLLDASLSCFSPINKASESIPSAGETSDGHILTIRYGNMVSNYKSCFNRSQKCM